MADNLAVDLVGDTSKAIEVTGDTSQAIDLIQTDAPSAVTAREQPRGYYGGGTFSRSARRGAKQTAGLFGQLMKLTGDDFNLAGMADIGDELIQEALVEAISNPARIGGFEDIGTLSDVGTWALQTLGEQVPNLALAATGGGLGGVAAKQMVGRSVINKVAQRAVQLKLDPTDFASLYFKKGGAGRRLLQAEQLSGAKKGAAAGLFGALFPVNTGEIIQEQRDAFEQEEAVTEPDLFWSSILGAGSTSLDVLGLGLIGKAIFGKAKKEVVGHTLNTVLRRTGHVTLASLSAEGGTEAVQEALVIASRKINDPTFSITDAIASSEGLRRIAFAGASGALVGGVLGGVGGVTTSVGSVAQLNAKRARIRAGDGVSAIRESFAGRDQVAEGEVQEAQSLVDFSNATPRIAGVVNGLIALKNKAATAVASLKNNEGAHTVGSVVAGVNATLARQAKAQTILESELEQTKKNVDLINTNRDRVSAVLKNIKAEIDQIPTVAEKDGKLNDVAHKISKSIAEKLAAARKLNVDKRAETAAELLTLLEELTAKAIKDPTSIAKNKLDKLHNAVKKFSLDGFAKLQRDNKAYAKKVNFWKTRVNNALKGLPSVEDLEDIEVTAAERAGRFEDSGKTTGNQLTVEEYAEDQAVREAQREDYAEQSRMRTARKKVVASAYKVVKGLESAAYAVGYRSNNLPGAVQALVDSGKLKATTENGETVLQLPNNNRTIREQKEFDFPKQIEELNPEQTVAVTNTTRETLVDNNEDALAEKAKNDAIGEETVFKTVDEVVEENLRDLNEEAQSSVKVALEKGKTSIAELFRAISGLDLITGLRTALKNAGLPPIVSSTKGSRITVANIPNNLVVFSDGTTWGQFKDTYDDAQHLAGLLAALDNKLADPESFVANANAALIEDVADLEDTIQNMVDGDLNADEIFGLGLRTKQEDSNIFFANTKNNRLVPVEVVTNPDGSKRIHVPSGAELAPVNKEKMQRKIGNKTSQELFVGAETTVVEEHAGMQLVRAIMPSDFPGMAVVLQLAKIKRRGDNTSHGKENKYVLKAKTAASKTIWVHLGEVTRLGMLLNREANNSSAFDKLTNSHRNFIGGLNALIADYGYSIDFRPNDIVVKQANGKQKVIKGRKSDLNKVIFGNTTYKQSRKAKPLFGKARQLFKEHIDGKEAAARWVEYVLTEIKGMPSMRDVAEWLLDEAVTGKIDTAEVSRVLFGEHGLVDPGYLRSVAMEDTTERDVLDGLALVQSTILSQTKTTKQIVDGSPIFIDSDGIIIREPRNDIELVEARDITTETELLESTILDAEPNTTVVQAQPGRKKPPQVSNMLSEGEFAIDEEGNAVQPKKLWKQAGRAVEAILKLLNIKERVVLFDDSTADQLVAGYEAQAKWYRKQGDEVTAEIYDTYAEAVEDAQLSSVAGRLITPYFEDATGLAQRVKQEHRVVHVYVSNRKNLSRRNLVVGHELGHLVWYTHLSRLSPKLQKQVLKALGASSLMKGQQGNVKSEAFANWMAKAAADMMVEYDRGNVAPKAKLKDAGELTEFFQTLLDTLFKAWAAIKKTLLPYPQGFGDFVAALNTHAEVQRGVRPKPFAKYVTPKNLTTPLSRQIFMELQEADAGLYLPDYYTGEAAFPENNLEIDATVDETVARAQDSVFGNYVDNFKKWAATLKDDPIKAGKMLIYTADAELRGMGEFGTKLARKFHALPSSTDPSNTVFTEIRIRSAKHFTALQNVLNSMPDARMSLWEMMMNKRPSAEVQARRAHRDRVSEALLKQTPTAQLSADVRTEVLAIRNYLKGLYRWYTEEMGMKLNEAMNYYPMMLDAQIIEQNREQFIEILQRHGFDEENSQNIRIKITRDEDGGLTNGFQNDMSTNFDFLGPGFSSGRGRSTQWTNELRAELVDAGFYQKDIATTLIAYTEMMTRRAVWQNRFQETRVDNRTALRYQNAGLNMHSPIARLQLDLVEAKARGDINEWQFNRITHDILPAYAGQLGLRTNSHIRKLSSGIVIYQNIRLLSMAIFAQFVDVGTLIARGDFRATQAAFTAMLDGTSRAEAYEMLEALGAMRQGLTEHVLNDQALNTFMTGSAKRINDLFFRYNGMEGWTNMMRAMALVSARDFIQRNAQKARDGDAKALRYIEELGLTVGEASAWDGHSTGDLKIDAALNRYIDEAMIRPDAAIRPVWMSDPGYGVFSHLKGFLYGFQETFLRRVGREARIHQNLLPLLALGMLVLPFAAIGYELRRKITGVKGAPDGTGYLTELVERAGLLGAFQMVADMEQADEYGKPFALGIGGPAVEQLFDFFDKDMSSWIPKAIPVVASVPTAREWVQDAIEAEE